MQVLHAFFCETLQRLFVERANLDRITSHPRHSYTTLSPTGTLHASSGAAVAACIRSSATLHRTTVNSSHVLSSSDLSCCMCCACRWMAQQSITTYEQLRSSFTLTPQQLVSSVRYNSPEAVACRQAQLVRARVDIHILWTFVV